jgi:hypothetical protein
MFPLGWCIFTIFCVLEWGRYLPLQRKKVMSDSGEADVVIDGG